MVNIWTSTDSGATWTEQTGSGTRDWLSIASSSDGTVRQGRTRLPTRLASRTHACLPCREVAGMCGARRLSFTRPYSATDSIHHTETCRRGL